MPPTAKRPSSDASDLWKGQKELNQGKNRSQGLLTTKRVMSCWLAWRWMTLWKNTSWFRMVSHIVSLPVTVPSIMVSCFNSNNSNISYYTTILYLFNYFIFHTISRFCKIFIQISKIHLSLKSRSRLDMPSRGHLIQSISRLSLPYVCCLAQ